MFHLPVLSWRSACRLVLVGLALLVPVDGVFGRPTAMRIFPKETLAFVRVAHAREAFEKFRETSFARMLEDPQIRPLLEHLYRSAKTAYEEELQEEIGLSLEEFAQIPQGEIAAGLIDRKLDKPTFAFLLDLGDESTAAHKLLDRVVQAMVDEGAARELETIGELEVTVVRTDGGGIEAVVFIERENTLIVAADVTLARQMLALWDAAETGEPAISAAEEEPAEPSVKEDGEEDEEENAEEASESEEPYWTRSLAENQQFVTVMRQCRTAGDEPPQLIGYAEPIGIFKGFARGEAGMAIAVATLKPLGLEGIRAVGYSGTTATTVYDEITHMHLLLDNPRVGVLSMVNLRSGDMTPEPWVPDDIETYITAYWDVPMSFEKLISLYDQFRGEGAMEKTVERNINEESGLDFRKEIIEQTAGRLTLLLGFPKPAKLRPRSVVFAVQVEDEEAAQSTVEKLVALDPDEFDEQIVGDVRFWIVTDAIQEGVPEEEQMMSPCFGVVDGYAMVSNSTPLFREVIAARNDIRGRLVDTDDYVEVAEHIARQAAEPAALMLNRPEETMRYVYGLATSEEIRDRLSEAAEDNPFFAALDEALTENPLPPFEVIAKYFAPAAGVVTDSETGIHYVQFTLRRD